MLLVPATDAGGISTWVRGMALGLAALGEEVQVVRWRDVSSPYSDKNRHAFRGLDSTDVVFDGLDKADRVAASLLEQLTLHVGDVVVSQNFQWVAALVSEARRVTHVRHVEVLHGHDPHVFEFAARALPTCDLFAAVSDEVEARLRREVLEPAGREAPVVVAPGGVEVPDGVPPRGGDEPLRVYYVGRISFEHKRIGDLAEAAGELVRRGVDFELTVVGPGEHDELARALEAAGAPGRTRLLGRKTHEDALALFREHDAWIQTSPREGAPIALAEAMAWGAVPVATRVGNCADVIDDGTNGFLVGVGDVTAMADRLETLARDRELLRRMSLAAHRKARDTLSVERRAESLVRAAAALPARSGLPRSTRLQRGRGLDRPWLPNWAVRGLRRAWRALRGQPADITRYRRAAR